MDAVFSAKIKERIKCSKVLVVGAGGIGCELLKNLVLSGFSDIEIVDLDTIDVSNLNRQFLFRREHVGKSKAKIARDSVLKMNPTAKIVAHHDSIISSKFGVNFIKGFDVVLNGLDNRTARNHVNRVCLASGVPLIESGTAGYLGQVELIAKGLTKCYECDPVPPTKSYPGCTIRNTPSEHVHCIVWAKHLFNQLFGEADEDEDVSPDTSDPDAGVSITDGVKWNDKEDGSGDVERVSTRKWAQQCDHDPVKVFNKFFFDDIKYLLTMGNLWKSRKPPTPMSWSSIEFKDESHYSKADKNKDERVWTLDECAHEFSRSLKTLSSQFRRQGNLVWDKDESVNMHFVTACANIRASIFHIETKSNFSTKSVAGNIIPAIATANAVIAGLVVIQAVKVLEKQLDHCQSVYLRRFVNPRGHLVVPEKSLSKPNPSCCVCSPMPQVTVCLDVNTMRCKEFESAVLKGHLNLPSPDVMMGSTVIISSEEGETDYGKLLKEVGVGDGSILDVDDFIQNYQLKIIISQREKESNEEPNFLVVGKLDELKPKEVSNGSTSKNGTAREEGSNGNAGGDDDDDDDDLEIIDEEVDSTNSKKRILEGSETSERKKSKHFHMEDENGCLIID